MFCKCLRLCIARSRRQRWLAGRCRSRSRSSSRSPPPSSSTPAPPCSPSCESWRPLVGHWHTLVVIRSGTGGGHQGVNGEGEGPHSRKKGHGRKEGFSSGKGRGGGRVCVTPRWLSAQGLATSLGRAAEAMENVATAMQSQAPQRRQTWRDDWRGGWGGGAS